MVRERKPFLKNWVAKKVKENSKKYGGDLGNSYIILEYLITVNPNTKVENLTLQTISESVAVSRAKNNFL